ncbi:EAL domain-containing protein [Altererythrobacter sp. KTW20L]|uniref:putative bifunctional diguanylate cyclase/phosphodiesterase n=1 Tax=Altererythrobacter sp. KTW20L TaxID=2942210 RepID=UPI0020C10208|nr:EAL domain-containing protein [Altererythrobacter sp. KTW20L]MCL6251736.1 EAL domain-containing protein [Altererythrobacter sp. KTW20L]
MHTRPIGLFTSAACGMAAGSTTLAITAVPALRWIALTLVIVAAARVVMAYLASECDNALGRTMRRIYPFGALAYAAIIGLAAATAILHDVEQHLQILLVGYAMTLGAGIAMGNAGRPLIAVGQMVLTFLPISLACFTVGTMPLVVLGLILPALASGLTYVTFNVFSSLMRQVRAAGESASLGQQMREQARTDPVTGLYNRTGFEAAAPAVLACVGARSQMALFWLDVRRFKEVNDMYGHHTGDRVLCEIATRLRARMPEGSICARFGSDEFLLLAPMTSRKAIEQLAGLLCADMALPMRVDGHRIESGASIGIATLCPGTPDLDQLMQNAGLALYHAKVAGRHQARFFAPSMTRDLARRKEIEAELRGAILRDELSIYFQPIMDLSTGRIRGFEALVRWFHPDKGELLPDEFIPVAEETGLIITLGNWITRTAARACASWPEDMKLAVNLSPAQISAPGAALGVLAALKEAQLDPRRLELEVTESLFVEDKHETTVFMEQLAAEGVTFALDDFGTGYSSLHYINKYPFSTIKVDRSFVSGPATGLRTEAIIRAVAEMGNTLGMEIVAEGLETSEQVEAVRRAGCTLGQGFHFSRAVPEHLALRLLEEERCMAARVLRAG